MIAFLVVRVPLMYRQAAGRDEDYYSVPGWTVAREGVPRIPFLPSRDPDRWFYRADEALLALPPANFYWQAPLFWILPAGHGTARLASAVAGLIAVVLLYHLARRMLQSETAALWAAGLYSISRAFFFPATNARPDMLCAAFGLASLLAAWHWQTTGRWRYAAVAGTFLGLGMLTHPFALVYCVQVGVWVLVAGRGLRGRLLGTLLLAGCAAAALALWLPLILAYPDHFAVQFSNNVLRPSGPGLFARIVWPVDCLVFQTGMFLKETQAVQFAIMLLGLLAATILAARRRHSGMMLAAGLAWSALYLLVIAAGTHACNGYWCYPAALMFLGVAYAAVETGRWLAACGPRAAWGRVIGGLLLVGAMLPGFGLRAWIAHLRHWSDINYRAPQFVGRLAADLPPDAHLVADPAFVFDLYLLGRSVILGWNDRFFFDVPQMPFDYLIVGPVGRQFHLASRTGARLTRAYGDPQDEFSCYAQIYTRGDPPDPTPPAQGPAK